MATAKQVSVYVNGVDLGASAFTQFTEGGTREALDATKVGSGSREYELGLRDGTISAEGIFSADAVNADDIHDILGAAFRNGTTNVVTASRRLLAVGGPAMLMNAVGTSYAVDNPTGQLVMVSAEMQSLTGYDTGSWLFSASVNTTTTTGTAVDNAALTSNGGIFHVHYQGGTGTQDLTAKIQHSTNNSTWADLGTVTVNDITGFGARSLEIAAGTTVNRYVRASIQVAQGALTVQAAFARR